MTQPLVVDVDGDGAGLDVLERDECLKLVASMTVGRIAVSQDGAAPTVVPVNYVLDGEDVVFRSGPGSKLRAMREAPVSFQVDQIDLFRHTGWSVLIRGCARQATDHEVAHLLIEPWAPGDKHHWIRILPTEISGRSMRLPDVPWEARGYL